MAPNFRTKLYDKRDDFNFVIVNFPFIFSSIPAAPAYGVKISQLIQYSSSTCIWSNNLPVDTIFQQHLYME
jgi:hypothetical protein